MSTNDDERAGVINERERTDICRDFMRNECGRGTNCKFYHPSKTSDGDDGSVTPSAQSGFQFCIAFRTTRGCVRGESCRYVHATMDQVNAYNETGDISPELAHCIADAKERSRAPAGGGEPVCMDFQRGECQRGDSCRYRHVGAERDQVVWERSPYGVGPTNGGGIRPFDYTSLKRPRIDGSMMAGPSMYAPPMMNNYAPPPSYEHTQAAALELQQCRQMITELKRENLVLRALADERQQRYDDLYAVFKQVTQLRQQ